MANRPPTLASWAKMHVWPLLLRIWLQRRAFCCSGWVASTVSRTGRGRVPPSAAAGPAWIFWPCQSFSRAARMTASRGSLRRAGQAGPSRAPRSLGAPMNTGPLGAWAPGPLAGYLLGSSTGIGRAAAACTVAGVHITGFGAWALAWVGALARWARATAISSSRPISRVSFGSWGSGAAAALRLAVVMF